MCFVVILPVNFLLSWFLCILNRIMSLYFGDSLQKSESWISRWKWNCAYSSGVFIVSLMQYYPCLILQRCTNQCWALVCTVLLNQTCSRPILAWSMLVFYCSYIFTTINLYYSANCLCLELSKANRQFVTLDGDRWQNISRMK